MSYGVEVQFWNNTSTYASYLSSKYSVPLVMVDNEPGRAVFHPPDNNVFIKALAKERSVRFTGAIPQSCPLTCGSGGGSEGGGGGGSSTAPTPLLQLHLYSSFNSTVATPHSLQTTPKLGHARKKKIIEIHRRNAYPSKGQNNMTKHTSLETEKSEKIPIHKIKANRSTTTRTTSKMTLDNVTIPESLSTIGLTRNTTNTRPETATLCITLRATTSV